MCSKISKYLTRRNWTICLCILVALLVAVGIFFLVRDRNSASNTETSPCKTNSNIKTAEDFKNNFGNEFIDDVSVKYLDMIGRNYLKEKDFYNSIILEFPTTSQRSRDINYILQTSAVNFEKLKPTENKTARVELIKLSKNLNAKLYSLLNSDSGGRSISTASFKKFQQLEQSKDEELYKTLKDINENWREKYKCIPAAFAKEYPQFGEIDHLFKDILASNADKTSFKVFTLFEEIDALFDNKVKVSQFGLAAENSPSLDHPLSGLQQKKQNGPQFVPNLSGAFPPNIGQNGPQFVPNLNGAFPPNIGESIKNNINALQDPIKARLSAANDAVRSEVNEQKNAIGSRINQAANEVKNAVVPKINQYKNKAESSFDQGVNTLNNRIKEIPL